MKQSIINILEVIGANFKTICILIIVVISIYYISISMFDENIRNKINETDIITIATFNYYGTGGKGFQGVNYNYYTDTTLQYASALRMDTDTGMVNGDKFLVVYSRKYPDISIVLRNSNNCIIRFTDSSIFAKYNYKQK